MSNRHAGQDLYYDRIKVNAMKKDELLAVVTAMGKNSNNVQRLKWMESENIIDKKADG